MNKRWILLPVAAFVLGLPNLAGRIVINEFVASNSTTLIDEDGDSADWIELHNAGHETVSLAGYGITDDLSLPFRWIFPDVSLAPGGFLIVWASGKDREQTLHTNFSISADGEPLQLTCPDGEVADFVPATPLPRDISFGRVPDGGEDWYYFDETTPGAANTTSAWLRPLGSPQLTHAPGFYEEPVRVGASSPDHGAVIRYTTNGDVPDGDSPAYGDPLWMTSRVGEPDFLAKIPTALEGPGYWDWSGPPEHPGFKINTLRIRAFKDGHLPSPVVSASYLVGEGITSRYSLPVVSIQTDFDGLFSAETGLFIPENYFNRGEEWEREAHIEFFEDGGLGFAQNIGVRIHGGYSRRAPMKSLRLYARGRYGESAIEYPIFPGKPNEVFERLILRSGGSDWALFSFRDAYAQSLVRELTGVSTQHFRSVVVFINGEYWGIHNLRDRYDLKFFEHEYDVTNVDLLTESHTVKEGSNEHYLEFYAYLAGQDMSSPEQLQTVRGYIDLEDFRDFHIGQIYVMHTDMHARNIDFWRSRDVIPGHPHADGRWRWLLFDLDASYGFLPQYAPPHRSGMIYFTGLDNIASAEVNPVSESPHWAENHPSETLPLRQMLMNPDFRADFINRFADLLNTAFSASFATHRLAEIQAAVEPYIPEHLNRWGIDRWNEPDDLSAWYMHRDRVLNFATMRPHFMRQDLRSFFNLGDFVEVTVNVDGQTDRGYLRVNSIDIHSATPGIADQPFPWSGIYFAGMPIKIRAIPHPGYRFAGWLEFPDETGDTLETTVAFGLTATAIFEPAPAPRLLHYWNFNDPEDLLAVTYSEGGAELSVEMVPHSEWLAGTGQGFQGSNAMDGDDAGTHLRLNDPIGSLLKFKLPTSGHEQPVLRLETRRSNQGAGLQYYSYTLDGVDYTPLATIRPSASGPKVFEFPLADIEGVADNPDFAIRVAFGRGTGGETGNNRFDNISLDAVSLTEEATWEYRYGFRVQNGYIDSGEFLGPLYVKHAPWVFHFQSGKWLFLPGPENELSGTPGVWIYSNR